MPVGKKNAHSQPAEGQPSLRRRHQVAHRQPEEEQQGSRRQALSQHRILLPEVPHPERFHRVVSQQAQIGSLEHRVVLPRVSESRREQTLHLPPLVDAEPQPPPRLRRTEETLHLPPLVHAAPQPPPHLRRTEETLHLPPLVDVTPQPPPHSLRREWTLRLPLLGNRAPQPPPRSLRSEQTVRLPPLGKTAPQPPPCLPKPGARWFRLPPLTRAASAPSSRTAVMDISSAGTSQCQLPMAAAQHQAPLPPVTPAQASPDFGMREAPTHAWREVPALQSTEVDTVPQVTGTCKEKKPLGQSVPLVQKASQQQGVEHQGTTRFQQERDKQQRHPMCRLFHQVICKLEKIMGLGKEAKEEHEKDASDKRHQEEATPVDVVATQLQAMPSIENLLTSEDEEERASAMSGDKKEEASKATVCPEAGERQFTASVSETPGAEAVTPHLAPGTDEGDATASLLAHVSQYIVPEAYVTGSDDPVAQEAGASLALSVTGRFVVLPMREVLQEQENLAVSLKEGDENAEKEEWKDGSDKGHQEEAATVDIWPAAEKEEHRAPVTTAAQEEEAQAPVTPDFGAQESEVEEQRKAFAMFSPTATEMLLQETAKCVVRDVLCKALAVIQEMGEQPQEHADESLVGATMPAMRPAAVQGTESACMAAQIQAMPNIENLLTVPCVSEEERASAMSGDKKEEASKATVCPEAGERQFTASVSETPGAEAVTPHLAPGTDEGDATASLLAHVSQYIVPEAYVTGSDDPVAQEAGASLALSVTGRFVVLPMREVLQEQENLAVSLEEDDENAEKEEWKDGSDKGHQEEAATVNIWPAAEKEEHRAPVTTAAQEEEAQAPVTPDFGAQESEVEEQRKAFAMFSPTATELLLQETAKCVVRDVLCKALAVIQEMGAPLTAVAQEEAQALHKDELAGSPASVQGGKEPGIDALLDAGAAQQRRPSRFRRVLKALRRAFRCSCIHPQVEE